jgi:hypothetical protein
MYTSLVQNRHPCQARAYGSGMPQLPGGRTVLSTTITLSISKQGDVMCAKASTALNTFNIESEMQWVTSTVRVSDTPYDPGKDQSSSAPRVLHAHRGSLPSHSDHGPHQESPQENRTSGVERSCKAV